ncbi:MAG: hypothetical protein ABEJ73_04150 [Haloplanus sp.]
MSSATADHDLVPTVDSPLDTVDYCLTAGSGVGILTYVVGLLVGNTEAATLGVGVGVACVLSTLTIRSAREVARALD